jgi:hypothetical protein
MTNELSLRSISLTCFLADHFVVAPFALRSTLPFGEAAFAEGIDFTFFFPAAFVRSAGAVERTSLVIWPSPDALIPTGAISTGASLVRPIDDTAEAELTGALELVALDVPVAIETCAGTCTG